jgi:flagellar biosynthesis protein FliP
VLLPAFVTSELKTAFQAGVSPFFIPFLIIDLVVASVLMALGMMMVPPSTISLPFKLMLFVLVDGWQFAARFPGRRVFIPDEDVDDDAGNGHGPGLQRHAG